MIWKGIPYAARMLASVRPVGPAPTMRTSLFIALPLPFRFCSDRSASVATDGGDLTSGSLSRSLVGGKGRPARRMLAAHQNCSAASRLRSHGGPAAMGWRNWPHHSACAQAYWRLATPCWHLIHSVASHG